MFGTCSTSLTAAARATVSACLSGNVPATAYTSIMGMA